MGTRMIWSKAAREKLDKELDLCLDAALFVIEFKPNDVLRVAWNNIIDVMKDLRDIISSKSVDKQKDDVSLIINECRLKVENQLQYVCDNSVSHNKAFKDFLVHFKSKIQGHLNADNDTGKGGTSKKKGKASQLTKLELQQQKDDEKKLNVCLEKQEAVKQLTRDYERILIDAFRNISNGYHDLYNIYGYEEEEEKWYHLDVSRMIKEYKSKVEKELKDICNKVSNPTIKEAFSRHLTDVTAGTIPAQRSYIVMMILYERRKKR